MTFTDAELLVCLPMLGRFAREYRDGEDLVQDTCAKAIRYRRNFHNGSLDAWLLVMLRRVAVDHARHAIHGTATGRVLRVRMARRAEPEQEYATLVHELTAELPPDHVWHMMAEGYDYAEIARMKGIPIGTVASRLARTREIMRARC